MTTPGITRTHNHQEFLSALPKIIGSTPHNSIVLVPLADHRTLGALRVDIPTEQHADALAATLLGHACRVDGMTSVALVIYTDEESAQAPGHGEAVIRRAHQCGTDVIAALYVASDGWGQLRSVDSPRALTEICRNGDDSDPAHTPPDGTAPHALPTERAGAILNALGNHEDSEESTSSQALLIELIAQTPRPEDLTPEDAGALLSILNNPDHRALALVQWASDPRTWQIPDSAQPADDETTTPLAAMILAGDAPRPSGTRLRNALNAAKHVAAAAPHLEAAGAFSTAAWLSWALGQSTHAEALARKAITIDPTQTMAGIVLAITNAGHLPAWAFRP
ncbi:DUF4192 family protein [Flaviflexus sp.]|uniref:DUF4192 family protein n=1 Tax=Flaviflexus sp. TaxID=1969482 RepID=UPI003F932CB7